MGEREENKIEDTKNARSCHRIITTHSNCVWKSSLRHRFVFVCTREKWFIEKTMETLFCRSENGKLFYAIVGSKSKDYEIDLKTSKIGTESSTDADWTSVFEVLTPKKTTFALSLRILCCNEKCLPKGIAKSCKVFRNINKKLWTKNQWYMHRSPALRH